MKLFVFIVAVFTVQLASASAPCDLAKAYHGSDCRCPSRLPFSVNAPDSGSPLKYGAFAFSIEYPSCDHEKLPYRGLGRLDATVQQPAVNSERS